MFVLLNLNNASAFFHEQYLCILSKYSVVATIWLQKNKQRRIKCYDTGSCKFWFIIPSLRKQGCKSTNYVICTLYYTPKKESIPAKSCKTSWGLYSRPLKTIFQHKVCIDKLYADSFYKVQKNSHSSFEVICCCS